MHRKFDYKEPADPGPRVDTSGEPATEAKEVMPTEPETDHRSHFRPTAMTASLKTSGLASATGGATPECECPCHKGEHVICNCGGGFECAQAATPEPKLEEVARKIADAIRRWWDGQAYFDEHSTMDSVIAGALRPYFEAKGAK